MSNFAYMIRDHAGFTAVGQAFNSRSAALKFMNEARGVEIIDGMFLADGYSVDMVEIA